MRRVPLLVSVCLVSVAAVCAPSVNLPQEREALLAADRDWSASAGDIHKFMAFLDADASVYPPGAPVSSGSAAIRTMFARMSAAPGSRGATCLLSFPRARSSRDRGDGAG
jgi:hypothetical protein